MIDICEATTLIRDMLPIMNPDDDYLTIVAAEEKIASSEAKRKKELDEAHANLKSLTRVLEAARISCTRPSSVASEEAHAATMNELDSSRLSLAKAISDAETLAANREAELSKLKEEARKLELCDPAVEHEKELDGSALRLAIYKGMGFEPIVEKDDSINKMLVRAQSGDVHVVDFTDGKTDFEYTQLLWKLVNS